MRKHIPLRHRRMTLTLGAALAIVIGAAAIGLTAGGSAGAADTPDDPRYPTQWSLQRIRAHEAWAVTQGSASVRVALLDSGVGYSSVPADVAANIGPGFDAFTGGSAAIDDYGTYGSGTSNAGVIGAQTNNARDIAGTAWNVTILPVKVCNFSGSCPHATIAAGIDWALAQNAQIIQITPAMGSTSPALEQAVARAVAAGKIVVAPVAEPGIGAGYPASLPGVIGVGATNSSDAVATFSANSQHVDITAPGQSIVTLVSGGCCVTRSMGGLAASHVTGALALLLSAGVPAAQAPQHLYDGAGDKGAPGWDAGYGWGILDICAALDDAGRTCSGAEATPTHSPTASSTPVPATSTPTRTSTPVPPTTTPTRTSTPAVPTPTHTSTPLAPSATPTRTSTPVPPTATNTPAQATWTPTRTPTQTSTPVAAPTCVKKGKGKGARC